MATLTDGRANPWKAGAGDTARGRRGGLFAAGGLAGALLASSCCVLPLVLVMLGIGGAWLGALTALTPYQPYLVTLAIVAIGFGFWNVHFRRERACSPGGACTRRASGPIVKTSLWLAAGIVLASATVDIWAPFFY